MSQDKGTGYALEEEVAFHVNKTSEFESSII